MHHGDGNDTVTGSDNILLDEFFIRRGQPDDTLTLVGNQVTGLAMGDGGAGTNRLTLLGTQFGESSFGPFV